MLARSNRLPSYEISKVMRDGKRVNFSGITLIYKKREMDSGLSAQAGSAAGMTTRVAFIVSTKVDKRATVRNRMRRIMSESVRHELPAMTHGIDGVFIGSKSLIGLTQVQVEAIVLDLLERVGGNRV